MREITNDFCAQMFLDNGELIRICTNLCRPMTTLTYKNKNKRLGNKIRAASMEYCAKVSFFVELCCKKKNFKKRISSSYEKVEKEAKEVSTWFYPEYKK